MASDRRVRPPAVAGMFYPDDPETLTQDINGYLAGSPSPADTAASAPVGLIVPHAGYMYSGHTAGAAYRCVQGCHFDAVVVVAPSHHEYFPGVSVFPGDSYATPLGEIAVNVPIREALLHAGAKVLSSVAGHGQEHAVEVQLPFLQTVLGEVSLVPLVMGDQSGQLCEHLASALEGVLRTQKVLLIASTDLSHYHRTETARSLDDVAMRDIASFDPETFLGDLAAGRTEACGGGPVAAVLMALRKAGATAVEIVHHCNSGDVTGERRMVVGYCSAVARR